MTEKTAPLAASQIAVVHRLPGRLRLRIRGQEKTETLKAIARQLRQQQGVKTVRENEIAGTLTATFDPQVLSLEQLEASLESGGSKSFPPEPSPVSSETMSEHLQSLIPLLLGLAVTRGLNLNGWGAILAYFLTATATQEVTDRLAGRIGPSPSHNSPPPAAVAAEPVLQVAHHLPGRIRWQIPRIRSDREYTQQLQQLLVEDPAVRAIRLNPASGSLLICYHPEIFSETVGDVRSEALAGSAAYFRHLIKLRGEESGTLIARGEPVTRETRELQKLTEDGPLTGNPYWSEFKPAAMSAILDIMANS